MIKRTKFRDITVFQSDHIFAAGKDKFRIMSNYENGLSHIPKPFELLCNLIHVCKVKTAGRFVENENGFAGCNT